MNPQEPQESLLPEALLELETLDIPIDLIDGPLLGDDPTPDLIESIKRLGILSPPLVQRVQPKKDLFFIVDGRRRLKAAKAAKLEVITVRVIPPGVSNPESYTLHANTTRRSNPLSEFKAIESLIAKGYTEKRIAEELRIKVPIIRKRMSFQKLNSDLMALFENGLISTSVAESASKLPQSYQEELLKVFERNEDKLTLEDITEAKRAKKQRESTSLSDMVFGDGESRKNEARAALSHLDSFLKLAGGLGFEVDSSSLDGLKRELSLVAQD